MSSSLGWPTTRACTVNGNGTCVARPIDPIGVTDLSFLGIPGMISYDPIALVNNGTYTRTRHDGQDVIVKSWIVEEDVTVAYAKFGLNTEMGSIPLTGNFGVQYISVDQSVGCVCVER